MNTCYSKVDCSVGRLQLSLVGRRRVLDGAGVGAAVLQLRFDEEQQLELELLLLAAVRHNHSATRTHTCSCARDRCVRRHSLISDVSDDLHHATLLVFVPRDVNVVVVDALFGDGHAARVEGLACCHV